MEERNKTKSRISAVNKEPAAPMYPHFGIANRHAARYNKTVTAYIFIAGIYLFALMKKKRKICFVITSGNHYSRSKLILRELQSRKSIDLQLVVGASALLPNYGSILSELGFTFFLKSSSSPGLGLVKRQS